MKISIFIYAPNQSYSFYRDIFDLIPPPRQEGTWISNEELEILIHLEITKRYDIHFLDDYTKQFPIERTPDNTYVNLLLKIQSSQFLRHLALKKILS